MKELRRYLNGRIQASIGKSVAEKKGTLPMISLIRRIEMINEKYNQLLLHHHMRGITTIDVTQSLATIERRYYNV
jgi:hypothetical protein